MTSVDRLNQTSDMRFSTKQLLNTTSFTDLLDDHQHKSPLQRRDPFLRTRKESMTVWDQIPLLEQINESKEREDSLIKKGLNQTKLREFYDAQVDLKSKLKKEQKQAEKQWRDNMNHSITQKQAQSD